MTPLGDGTGPFGQGPVGKGLGPCGGGQRRGWCGGRGQGGRRGRGRGPGLGRALRQAVEPVQSAGPVGAQPQKPSNP